MTDSLPWGSGPARLVKPAVARGSTEIVLIGGDFHFPHHDEALTEGFLDLAATLQPDRVILNGDLIDAFMLSRFNQGKQERLDELQNEIDMACSFRAQLRKQVPDAQIEETTGNHDSRLVSYIQTNARGLTSLRDLDPARLMRYADAEVTHHPEAGFLLRENFLVRHGSYIRSGPAGAAKAECMSAGLSGASGHVHRLEAYRRGGYAPIQWWSGGALCQSTPDYTKGTLPDWTRGCLVGQFQTTTSSFLVEPVQEFQGSLVYGGRRYGCVAEHARPAA